jgi:hypothetical protein
MNKLKDFLSRRRKELAAALAPLMDERAHLDAKIHGLRRELTEIDQAAKAIGLEEAKSETRLLAEHRKAPPLTIKEAVLAVLREDENGLTALDILAKINRRFGLGIIRTSLSPQLSRLKRDRKIANEGTLWRAVPQKEGPTK